MQLTGTLKLTPTISVLARAADQSDVRVQPLGAPLSLMVKRELTSGVLCCRG
jgi:hypothetical protein